MSSTNKKILIRTKVPGLSDLLLKNLPDRIVIPNDDKEFLEILPNFEILLVDPDDLIRENLKFAKNCKWIQSTWAGLDTLLKDNIISKRNFIISRHGGLGKHIGEYIVQQILNIERKYDFFQQNQKLHIWEKTLQYRAIDDLTIGIMGFGSIGLECCKILKVFGAKLKVLKRIVKENDNDKNSNPDISFFDNSQLKEFLKDSDYVVNTLPKTPQTRDLLSGTVLQNCNEAIFINCGRGDIVSEQTLLTALDQRWLSQCVLDVFKQEPLPSESLLWNHPKIVVTPHCAAISMKKDIFSLFLKNLQYFDTNELDKIMYQLDWNHGY